MLCEKCHQREATVHLTSCVAGEDSVAHLDFCEVCFPVESMSQTDRDAALRKLFNTPPAEEGRNPEEGDDTR